MKAIWSKLAAKYTTDSQLITELWTEIKNQYTSKHRYYHNLGHLEYMAQKAMEHKAQLTYPDAVLFAIFYHDIIYNPQRKNNEQKSAETARDRLTKLGVPEGMITECCRHILATKEHKASPSNDTNYLVDIDLAILGDTPEKYLAYAKGIRKEYALYPDVLYKKGRKKVLQHLLSMDRIFKTEAFYQRYEQQARENLQKEYDQY